MGQVVSKGLSSLTSILDLLCESCLQGALRRDQLVGTVSRMKLIDPLVEDSP